MDIFQRYFDQDIIYLIALCLPYENIIRLKSCSRFFYNLLSQEIFWLTVINHRVVQQYQKINYHFCNNHVPQENKNHHQNILLTTNKWVENFKLLLRVSNYHDVYCFFRQLSFPIINSYGKIIPLDRDASTGDYDLTHQSYLGGLMKISTQHNIIYIENNGEQRLYEIQYSSQTHQIRVCDTHANHIYTLRCINNMLYFFNLTNECVSKYQPLYYDGSDDDNEIDNNITPHNNGEKNDIRLFPQSFNTPLFPTMNKLYNGVYGPHGNEIIFLKFEKFSHLATSLISRLPSQNHWNACEYVLIGRKITGDANVPAQQLSFILNPNASIKNLSRAVESMITTSSSSLNFLCLVLSKCFLVLSPAITFISTEDLVFLSLVDRLPFITSCYKAFGQINRHPGVWSPEWLHAYFVVYLPVDHPSRQSTTEQNSPSRLPAGVAFSIVFVHHLSDDVPAIDNDEELLPVFTGDGFTRSHMIDFSISCWS